MSWQFDHFNLQVSGEADVVRFFGDVMGWQPGYRPAFPFPGTWLYEGEQALLHILPVPGDKPEARLAHLAFRSEEPAQAVLERLRLSGMAYQIRSHPDKGAAQIFVALPGGLVLELEAPLDGPLPEIRTYDANPRLMLGTHAPR